MLRRRKCTDTTLETGCKQSCIHATVHRWVDLSLAPPCSFLEPCGTAGPPRTEVCKTREAPAKERDDRRGRPCLPCTLHSTCTKSGAALLACGVDQNPLPLVYTT